MNTHTFNLKICETSLWGNLEEREQDWVHRRRGKIKQYFLGIYDPLFRNNPGYELRNMINSTLKQPASVVQITKNNEWD